GGTGLAKCIQAALLRTRRCCGESRQLEDHPRTAIQFRHAEVQGRPFGRYLEFGTRSYVGCSADGEILAVAAENDRRLGRCNVKASVAKATTRAALSRARTASYRSTALGCARTTGAALGCAGTPTTATTAPAAIAAAD